MVWIVHANMNFQATGHFTLTEVSKRSQFVGFSSFIFHIKNILDIFTGQIKNGTLISKHDKVN